MFLIFEKEIVENRIRFSLEYIAFTIEMKVNNIDEVDLVQRSFS